LRGKSTPQVNHDATGLNYRNRCPEVEAAREVAIEHLANPVESRFTDQSTA